MSEIRIDEIRQLLDQHRGAGMVVSCYANTSVEEGFESHWRPHLKAEATRIRIQMAEAHRALEEFERHLAAIHDALETPEAHRAKGMAVFASATLDPPLSLPSGSPYENRLHVGHEPYVVPLVMAASRRCEYLVVLTNSHHGQCLTATSTDARVLAEVGDARSSPTGSDRQRDAHSSEYQKALAKEVEKAWTQGSYRGIILLGPHELLEEFRDHLPGHLAERVVHEAPHSWAGEHLKLGEISRVAADAIEGRQCRLLAEIDRRLKLGFAVTRGPQEVIEALDNGQVVDLVIGPDLGEIGSHCTGCLSLFAADLDTCPYCKASCVRTDLWQEVLTRALRHDVPVHFVSKGSGHDVPGEVAALLARDEPQWVSDETVIPTGL